MDSSEATPYPRELPAPHGRDTPVSAEFARITERAVGVAGARSSGRNLACSALRAGLHDFLTGLVSPDAGDFSSPACERGWASAA